ncbi:MAG: oxidoreductase [Gammaproteobacteria bacterium]|nr:oxidoreductase [Gammaproteobacteria bacterium]HOP17253.1 MDR family oxidoreductase [Gammaproteobacteria bacterium]
MTDTFKALVLTQEDGKTVSTVKQLGNDDLPEGDVLLAVEYSSLNYKDGLAITGKGKIVRQWPLVPGIDLAGNVLESTSSDYAVGDKVVLTGWSVGEKYWGGYSQRQRVQSQWLVPLPAGMDTRQAMAIGTAGFTAMLCVMTLEEAGVTPDKGPVVVTGATGGVGSIAVAILHKLGFQVTAVSGKPDAEGFLRDLGASEILTRDEMSKPPRPLEGQRWAGAVDTVGSTMLARVIAETHYNGCVAACGLAGGFDLPTTVMPFILRNVSLRGVDSVSCPVERRKQAWQRLVSDLPAQALGEIGQVANLEQLPELAEKITNGAIRGRVIVDLNA